MEVGKVYSITSGKVVLVFGIAEHKGFLGKESAGIGINLDTGEVDDIVGFAYELRDFDRLSKTQILNFCRYYPISEAIRNSHLVAITGKSRSGKDTLATRIVGRCHYIQTTLGEPVQRIRNVLYGNSDKKDRKGLILIGQGMREKDPHVWTKVWLRQAIKRFAHNPNTKLVISDVRQPSEFTFLKSMGAFTVRIDANEEKRRKMIAKVDGEEALDEKLLNNETELHIFDTDLIIFNEYDETYHDEMDRVIESLKAKGS
ncbi:hypothetical protein NMK43_08860 [Bacillus licheniformis]|uniref:hypothetical protein n=1 Tax=Bacillus licheniformis TaxID=1402 RepID=UPI0020C871EE|nr:hypothetical protein [Bacillus licheniformis]MCP8973204.1 hypothetical protein [Bacillus licheniformis]